MKKIKVEATGSKNHAFTLDTEKARIYVQGASDKGAYIEVGTINDPTKEYFIEINGVVFDMSDSKKSKISIIVKHIGSIRMHELNEDEPGFKTKKEMVDGWLARRDK